jgi:hypothetical protein
MALNNLVNKLIRTICAGVLVGTTALSKPAYAEMPEWLHFSVEPFRADLGTTESTTQISNIPEAYRTVPSHPHDPKTNIKPIPDGTYLHAPEFKIIDYGRAQVSLFDLVGIGVRFATSSEDDEEPMADYFDEANFEGNAYNYAPHYAPSWGDAFVLYQVYYETDVPPVGFFVEGKTPYLKVFDGVKIRGFGGWEPDVAEIEFKGMNGYHRWNSQEVREEFDLGEVSMDRIYAGLEVSLDNQEENGWDVGLRLYYMKNSFDDSGLRGGTQFDGDVDETFGASMIINF